MKSKISNKIEERNTLAEALKQPEITYEGLQTTNAPPWELIGQIDMDQLLAYANWERTKEEIYYVTQDIIRTTDHLDSDISMLTNTPVKSQFQDNDKICFSLEQYRDYFIEKLRKIKKALS
jgi:hypothetical protein